MASQTTRVLVAFDKFKDSLTSENACTIAAHTLKKKHPTWVIDLCPFSDGGDGFERLLTTSAKGRFVDVQVDGPLLIPVASQVGLVPVASIPTTARALLGWDNMDSDMVIAVAGMASASGLAMLKPTERDPWKTTSLGTGQLIRAAVEAGAKGIVLGLGGSATNDLGLGALAALGYSFEKPNGELIDPPIPEFWSQLSRISRHQAVSPIAIRIACDVDNPLLGANGAAAIYGPQKGLKVADLAQMERESARVANLLCAACDQPAALQLEAGSGAAGGAAFGLKVGLGASLVPGTRLVSAWVGLDERMASADILITGEGRFDASSLSGKGPAVLAQRARLLGKTVHIFAGALSPDVYLQGVTLHAITPEGVSIAEALAQAKENLARSIAEAL